jgi:hypothetical protein
MPQEIRVGDRERAAAAERLSAHHAAGRLSVDELEQRLERANAAVYTHQLDELEADLPGARRRPATPWWADEGTSVEPRPRHFAAPRRPVGVVAPFALIAVGVAGSIAVGHPLVPLFVLAAFLLWRRAACA